MVLYPERYSVNHQLVRSLCTPSLWQSVAQFSDIRKPAVLDLFDSSAVHRHYIWHWRGAGLQPTAENWQRSHWARKVTA